MQTTPLAAGLTDTALALPAPVHTSIARLAHANYITL